MGLGLKPGFAEFPKGTSKETDTTITRWARLITWLAKDTGFPPAERKRGVSVRVIYAQQAPDPQQAGILIQQALVEAGLLLGRTPEWMDATTTQLEAGPADAVRLQMWDKPDMVSWR